MVQMILHLLMVQMILHLLIVRMILHYPHRGDSSRRCVAFPEGHCVRGKGFVVGGSCAVVGSSKSHHGCVVLLKNLFRDGLVADSSGGKASGSVESNANFSNTGGYPL